MDKKVLRKRQHSLAMFDEYIDHLSLFINIPSASISQLRAAFAKAWLISEYERQRQTHIPEPTMRVWFHQLCQHLNVKIPPTMTSFLQEQIGDEQLFLMNEHVKNVLSWSM